ncbi:Hermansky-Pudlak syndrome 3 protein [Bufo bufo]|uniref:Hermansky-Pudlak syndrome 3 protein n=1 Tax=Bufo bufo TaxID=8384 RepID=UPI001ABEDBCF|nr:Hermansky-Pudlak syndrome 3 protein [Bufo bufo]
MVQLYNCHPFGSQRIVPTKQAPEVFCCGRDSVFVTCAGGCKVEVFNVGQELCHPLCSFNTLGKVVHMSYSDVGDYLVTIEEKNNISSLRVYVNWRCQTAGSSRVSVRMVGLQLESLQSGISKDQMEIIEMPLSDNPLCLCCCPVRGDLLVGCRSTLVIFHLKYIAVHETAMLDFDRFLVLHISGMVPSQLCFCSGHIGVLNDLEVLVFRLSSEPPKGTKTTEAETLSEKGGKHGLVVAASHPLECDDFVMCQRPVELVGEDCESCSIVVTPESTGLSMDAQSHVNYMLYRRFSPDFTDGFSVESTRLHSLQLLPMYKTGNHFLATDAKLKTSQKEVSSLFCFFSMPHAGFLYTLVNAVELISVYQYPERSQQAVLTPQFLHVITSNNLQCFTVRCSAAAAREEDPYIDTTMKTCPPVSLDVCTLRMQLFIGLKAIQHFNNYIIILTKADVEDMANKTRNTKSSASRKASSVKNKPSGESEHGWNLYVVSTTATLQLYKEMVEYSKRYETVKTYGSIHLLSEAHLLLRAALINPDLVSEEKEELMASFRESCADLGDCFSRLDTKNSHLALPYYKMSCLSVSDVIERVLSKDLQDDYGKGFMFYLKHSLYEELDEQLSEMMALKVLQIFNAVEPSQLPHALCSPCMTNACPKKAMSFLKTLEVSGPSALIYLTKAAMALKMEDLQAYEAEMQRYSEMQLLYGFLEEPRLIFTRRDREIIPTKMAFHFRDTLPGLLVAVLVTFHENSKINLKEAESFFKASCNKTGEDDNPQMLVDFWEARLSSYPPESILQDILFKLTSHYVRRICKPQHACVQSLKSPEDLRNSCSHFGVISPWITKMVSSEPVSCAACGDLMKLQSLLCGPSLDIVSFLPFLDSIPDSNNSYLSIHIICATRLLNYEGSIERLLDRCPEAVTLYAKHEIKDGSQALWWNKLLPELCNKVRGGENTDEVFISSLKDTLDVIAMELDLQDFLNLLPDDGNAEFFLPYLVIQSKRKLVA